MTKTITNNVILKDFDTFVIIENIKEVDKLYKVYEGCTLDNDFNIVREKIITKLHDFTAALNYFNCELPHNSVNFKNDLYEIHEYILKCCSSEYNELHDTPTVYLLNGGLYIY